MYIPYEQRKKSSSAKYTPVLDRLKMPIKTIEPNTFSLNLSFNSKTQGSTKESLFLEDAKRKKELEERLKKMENQQKLVIEIGRNLNDTQKKKVSEVIKYGGGNKLALTGNTVLDSFVLKNKITNNDLAKASPATYTGVALTAVDLLVPGSLGLATYAGIGAKTFSKALNKFSSLADKKVRFEIDDRWSQLLKPETLKIENELNKLYDDITPLRNKWTAGNATKEELKQFDKIAKKITDLEFKNSDIVNIRLSDVFIHDELYRAYPELKDVNFRVGRVGFLEGAGNFNPTTNTITINRDIIEKNIEQARNIVLHEIQHWVQFKENFARGGGLSELNNPITQSKVLEWMKKVTQDKYGSRVSSSDYKYLDNLIEKTKKGNKLTEDDIVKLFDSDKDKYFERAYTNLAGEIEARDVQARMNLSAEERAKTLLYKSQNIPLDEQIVRFGDNEMAFLNVRKTAIEREIAERERLFNKATTVREKKNYKKAISNLKKELDDIRIKERQMSIESPITDDIAKAKAEGKSFEEFVESQGKIAYRGGEKFTGEVGERGLPLTIDKSVAKTFLREKRAFRENPAGQIMGLKPEDIVLEEYVILSKARIATKNNIPTEVYEAYKRANPTTKPEIAEPIISKWARGNGFDAVDFSTLGKTSAKEAEIKILNPDIIKTKAQLKQLWDKADSGKMMSYEPARIVENSVKPKITEDLYIANRTFKKGVKDVIKKDFNDIKSGIRQGLDKYFGSISTRLKNIKPELKSELRKFEFNTKTNTIKDIDNVLPFMQKTRRFDKADWLDLDLAMKNGDKAKIDELVKKYGLENEYKQLRNTLDDLYKRAEEVGFDIGYKEAYHPRVIKDTKGFLNYFRGSDNWPLLDDAIRAKENALQRYLTEEEKATLINTMIRGYNQNNITLSEIGQMKNRVIDVVDAELNQFYMTSDGALMTYINKANEAIAARKFFGKGDNLDDSIGAYILELLNKGEITPDQEVELASILRARFNEKGTRGVVGLYKNLSYIDTMGSPTSALTQIGDLAFSLYKGGVRNTVKGIWKSMTGKSQIKRADIGIVEIASEFMDGTKASNAVNKVFKLVGLEKIDAIGKETLIESVLSKYQKWAKSGDERLLGKIKPIFGDDYFKVLDDLSTGRISEDIKLLAFNELADVQPILLSEMPEKYLTGGNGRIFYMLKTYTLKLFDVYRNEVFQEIAKGNKVQGIKNLMYLAGALVAMNATADEIKDLLLGRETSLKDTTVDNALRLVGFSKYLTWKARTEGIGSAAARQILPPFKFIDSTYKDIFNDTSKGYETIQSIPIGGKLYYWWFGKGSKKNKKEKDIPLLPKIGLPKLPKIK